MLYLTPSCPASQGTLQVDTVAPWPGALSLARGEKMPREEAVAGPALPGLSGAGEAVCVLCTKQLGPLLGSVVQGAFSFYLCFILSGFFCQAAFPENCGFCAGSRGPADTGRESSRSFLWLGSSRNEHALAVALAGSTGALMLPPHHCDHLCFF